MGCVRHTAAVLVALSPLLIFASCAADSEVNPSIEVQAASGAPQGLAGRWGYCEPEGYGLHVWRVFDRQLRSEVENYAEPGCGGAPTSTYELDRFKIVEVYPPHRIAGWAEIGGLTLVPPPLGQDGEPLPDQPMVSGLAVNWRPSPYERGGGCGGPVRERRYMVFWIDDTGGPWTLYRSPPVFREDFPAECNLEAFCAEGIPTTDCPAFAACLRADDPYSLR